MTNLLFACLIAYIAFDLTSSVLVTFIATAIITHLFIVRRIRR